MEMNRIQGGTLKTISYLMSTITEGNDFSGTRKRTGNIGLVGQESPILECCERQ